MSEMAAMEFSVATDYVYFIYDGVSSVKIGIAKDYEKRLRELQTSNPNKLSLLDAFWCGSRGQAQIVERELHKLFGPFRKSGEWFGAEPVLYWLNTYASQDSVTIGPYEWRQIRGTEQ